MYEKLNLEKMYRLPDGTEVLGQYFVDNDQYDTSNVTETVVDVSGSYVNSFDILSRLKDVYAVDLDGDGAIDQINLIISNNKRASSLINTGFDPVLRLAKITAISLPDEQAIEVPELYPEYELNHEYKQNDRFQYGGTLYKVNQAHTSQEQWVPGTDGTESLYTNLMLNDDGYQIWKQPTGAHDAYNTGDVVEYNGVLYKSLIDGNAWAPDAYPQGWQEYVEE